MMDRQPGGIYSTARIGGHPIHPMLIPFPVAFLVTAFVTDLAFLGTGNPMWATASMWLLGAGVVMALVAAVAGFTDFFGNPRIRELSDVWYHFVGNLIIVVVAAVNWFLRYNEGATTALSSWGWVLSLVVLLGLLFTGWKGWDMVYRQHVAIDMTPHETTPHSSGPTYPDHRRAA